MKSIIKKRTPEEIKKFLEKNLDKASLPAEKTKPAKESSIADTPAKPTKPTKNK